MAKPTLADALLEIDGLKNRVAALEAADKRERKKERRGGKDRPGGVISTKDNGVAEGVEGGSTPTAKRVHRVNVRGRIVTRAIAVR